MNTVNNLTEEIKDLTEKIEKLEEASGSSIEEITKKNTAKKPIAEFMGYFCPGCSLMFSLTIKTNDEQRYCQKCGQKLDWSAYEN